MLLLGGLFALCVLAAEPDPVAQSEDFIAKGTYAIPIKRYPPKYPAKALRAGIEGWVVVNFSVLEDGSTDDIVVLDSSIEEYFDQEAIKTVKRWKYKPATWDGIPVLQGNKNASIVFTMSDAQLVLTGKFKSSYEEAQQAIANDNLEKAKKVIDELDASKKRKISEVCHLDILKADYLRKLGDHVNTLRYLNRALVIADVAVEKHMYVRLLKLAFEENVNANNYLSALEHFDTLLKVDSTLSPQDSIRARALEIRETIKSSEDIVTQGEIRQCDDCLPDTVFWQHDLNRDRFSIDKVEGEVWEAEIICGFQSVSLAYSPGAIWSTEDDWGRCHIRIFGEIGTTLQLTEFAQIPD
jgi:TonB family protein